MVGVVIVDVNAAEETLVSELRLLRAGPLMLRFDIPQLFIPMGGWASLWPLRRCSFPERAVGAGSYAAPVRAEDEVLLLALGGRSTFIERVRGAGW